MRGRGRAAVAVLLAAVLASACDGTLVEPDVCVSGDSAQVMTYTMVQDSLGIHEVGELAWVPVVCGGSW